MPNIEDLTWTDVAAVVVMMLSLVWREQARAWVAHAWGDSTPKEKGRLTFNPLPHVSFLGTVVIPIAAVYFEFFFIGWAKPVPTDRERYRWPFLGDLCVSLTAIVVGIVLVIGLQTFWHVLPAGHAARAIAFKLAYMNVILVVFHLIPIPPFDMFEVAKYGFPPKWWPRMRSFGAIGGWLVLALLIFTEQARRTFRDAASYVWDLADAVAKTLAG